jgi:YD repeat-containing protein
MFPVGSRQPYTYVDLILCDGDPIHYDRISKGTGYADALYEHRTTATPFLSSCFGWNGNGWDLKLKDGSLLLFPESYYAKRPVDGAIVDYRDGKGQTVKIERHKRRNLRRLTSPFGRFITFDYDSSERIVKAVDDQSRTLSYLYDSGGRLVSVEKPGSVKHFAYDDTLLTSIEEDGRPLIAFSMIAHESRKSRFRMKVRPTKPPPWFGFAS